MRVDYVPNAPAATPTIAQPEIRPMSKPYIKKGTQLAPPPTHDSTKPLQQSPVVTPVITTAMPVTPAMPVKVPEIVMVDHKDDTLGKKIVEMAKEEYKFKFGAGVSPFIGGVNLHQPPHQWGVGPS